MIDLRLAPAALSWWAGSLAGFGLVGAGTWFLVPGFCVALVVGAWRWWAPEGRHRRQVLVAAVALVAAPLVVVIAVLGWHRGPIQADIDRGSRALVVVEVTGDPVAIAGGPTPVWVEPAGPDGVVPVAHQVPVDVLMVIIGEQTWEGSVPARLTLSAGALLADTPSVPGTVWRVAAVLGPGEVARREGLRLSGRGSPEVLEGAGALQEWAAGMRSGLAAAAAGAPGDGPALLPGLVLGDTSGVDDNLDAAMKAAGLAHLTAVSGANVALVLALALGLARLVGVRGRALPILGGAVLLGFVVLVRPDPSVVRAAVMGAVILVGVLAGVGRRGGPGSPGRGPPVLLAAVLLLLILDPWLAVSVGFALSVLATAALLLLAPRLILALGNRWGRGPAIFVTAVVATCAAQVATAPVLVGIGAGLAPWGLLANLLAAPVVPAATVAGLLAALVYPIAALPATMLAWCGGACAAWIGAVARWCAGLPLSHVPWPEGPLGSLSLIGVGVALAVGVWLWRRRPVARRPLAVLAIGGVIVAFLPTPGAAAWPPPNWSVVACDVGQGDALVLRVDEGSAVVIDTGPDPEPVRRCLQDLGIVTVPALVLTHFHADHVGGLGAVLQQARVGVAMVSPLPEPEGQAARVGRMLADANVPEQVSTAGEIREIGSLRLEVLWPSRILTGEESAPNNASVVLLARSGPLDVLLTGDLEPAAQAALIASGDLPEIDVVKVPHHGSPRQDPRFASWVGAGLALVDVGENNYGHPSAVTMDNYAASGSKVLRTDTDGDIAITVTDQGEIAYVTRGPTPAE